MRRQALVPAPVLVLVLVLVLGCGAPSPRGWDGVRFGNDAAGAAAELGVACGEWRPWTEGSPFEVARTEGTVRAYGQPAEVTLVRAAHALEGIVIRFRGPVAAPALVAAIVEEYGLDPDEDATSAGIFVTWSGREVVRFEAHTLTLMVAGRRFGPAYQARLLREGLGDLGDALRPH